MLDRLCTTWHGWVSAAVYFPSYTYGSTALLHLAVAKLDRLHSSLDQAGKVAAWEDASHLIQHDEEVQAPSVHRMPSRHGVLFLASGQQL